LLIHERDVGGDIALEAKDVPVAGWDGVVGMSGDGAREWVGMRNRRKGETSKQLSNSAALAYRWTTAAIDMATGRRDECGTRGGCRKVWVAGCG
jgi:hypothetical protein